MHWPSLELLGLEAIHFSWLATSLLFVWLHWCGTKEELCSGLEQLCEAFRSLTTPEPSKHSARIDEELSKIRVANFLLAARVMVHIGVIAVLVALVEVQRTPSATSLLTLLLMFLLWSGLFLSLRNVEMITREKVRIFCVGIYICVLTGTISTAWEEKEEFIGRYGLTAAAHLVIGICFWDKEVSVPFAVCLLCASVWATVEVCGPGALAPWLLFQQTYLLVLNIALPAVFEKFNRDRIAASFESQDADTLITAFRQMLKGICDGDLLLDGSFRICGSSDSLKRILQTHEDFVGRTFQDLIEDSAQTQCLFNDFLERFTKTAENSEKPGAPQCLRVPLKAPSGRTVSVDVFHVSLPRLYGATSMHHLLALTEDTDSRIQPDAAQDAIPHSLLTMSVPGARSTASSESDIVQAYDELAELTLLVDVSKPLLDIEEAHMRFVRRSQRAEMQLGMPTLKRFARTLDWEQLHASLCQYSNSLVENRADLPQNLPPVMLRLPGESRRHLLARHVSVTSPFKHKDRTPSQGRFLYLHLRKFKGSGRRPRQLEGVEEDPDCQHRPEGSEDTGAKGTSARGPSVLHRTSEGPRDSPAMR